LILDFRLFKKNSTFLKSAPLTGKNSRRRALKIVFLQEAFHLPASFATSAAPALAQPHMDTPMSAPLSTLPMPMLHDVGRKLRVKEALLGMMHMLRTLGLKMKNVSELPESVLDHLAAASVSLSAALRILRRGKRKRTRRRLARAAGQVCAAETPQIRAAPSGDDGADSDT
jgi:hypothetical protein